MKFSLAPLSPFFTNQTFFSLPSCRAAFGKLPPPKSLDNLRGEGGGNTDEAEISSLLLLPPFPHLHIWERSLVRCLRLFLSLSFEEEEGRRWENG